MRVFFLFFSGTLCSINYLYKVCCSTNLKFARIQAVLRITVRIVDECFCSMARLYSGFRINTAIGDSQTQALPLGSFTHTGLSSLGLPYCRTLLPLLFPLSFFPQPPRARLREMIKTSKALPHCRSKLKADGGEPDPAQTSSASPQSEICHSQHLPCSTPLISPCQSEAARGSTCSLVWVRAV